VRLRGFFNTNPNGLRVKIWTTLCVYPLILVAKQETRYRTPCTIFCNLPQLPLGRKHIRLNFLKNTKQAIMQPHFVYRLYAFVYNLLAVYFGPLR